MFFSSSPANVTVERGGKASFICTYPCTDVNITWNGPGVEAGVIMSMMETKDNTSSKTSNLTITNVNSSHMGKYFCTAHVNESMVNSTAANLTVKCKYKTRKVIVYMCCLFNSYRCGS